MGKQLLIRHGSKIVSEFLQIPIWDIDTTTTTMTLPGHQKSQPPLSGNVPNVTQRGNCHKPPRQFVPNITHKTHSTCQQGSRSLEGCRTQSPAFPTETW